MRPEGLKRGFNYDPSVLVEDTNTALDYEQIELYLDARVKASTILRTNLCSKNSDVGANLPVIGVIVEMELGVTTSVLVWDGREAGR